MKKTNKFAKEIMWIVTQFQRMWSIPLMAIWLTFVMHYFIYDHYYDTFMQFNDKEIVGYWTYIKDGLIHEEGRYYWDTSKKYNGPYYKLPQSFFTQSPYQSVHFSSWGAMLLSWLYCSILLIPICYAEMYFERFWGWVKDNS